jgi:transposase
LVLRTLLIHGARSVIQASTRQADKNPWLKQLLERRPTNVAAVALANKNARIVWALMAQDERYEPNPCAA